MTKQTMIVKKGLPKVLCRWWLKTRSCRNGIQINNDMPECIEFYVPWWAWSFEILHMFVFGESKLIKRK